MTDQYLRQAVGPGWNQENLSPDRHLLVVVGSGLVAGEAARMAACLGMEAMVLVAADEGPAEALAEELRVHNPRCLVQVRRPGYRPLAGLRRVTWLVDTAEEASGRVVVPEEEGLFAWAAAADRLVLGQDLLRVRAAGDGRPVPERAEAQWLAAEAASAALAFSAAWRDPGCQVGLAAPPRLSSIPLPALPDPATVGPLRLYTGGLGGAVSAWTHRALALDPWTRSALTREGGLVAGADDDVVDETNRGRVLWRPDEVGLRKARVMAARLADALPGARVVGFEGPMDLAHLTELGPVHGVLSSVDSWGDAGRAGLFRLARDGGATWVVSAGTWLLGASVRTVHRDLGACPWWHGWERVRRRPEGSRSCADEPVPSQVVPQALAGALAALLIRDRCLGIDRVLGSRGFEVHLGQIAWEGETRGLRASPGLASWATCPSPGFAGEEGPCD